LRRAPPFLLALGAVAVVLVPYLALGGASFEPTPVADPCVTREWRDPDDPQALLEQIVLSALDGAACELRVTREDLVIAVKDEASLDSFAREQGLSRDDAERAVHDGLERAIGDAEKADALPGFAVSLLRRAIESLPPWLLLEAIESLAGIVST